MKQTTITRSQLKELVRQSIYETIYEADDDKYTHIGYGKFKGKGKEKDQDAETFKKTDTGDFVPYKITNGLVYISGQGPLINGKVLYKGKVNHDITINDGIDAAKICCLNIVAAIKHSLNGDWTKFDEIVKLGGFVNSNNDFILSIAYPFAMALKSISSSVLPKFVMYKYSI